MWRHYPLVVSQAYRDKEMWGDVVGFLQMSWQSHTLFSWLYSVGYEAVAVALFFLEEELKNCKTFWGCKFSEIPGYGTRCFWLVVDFTVCRWEIFPFLYFSSSFFYLFLPVSFFFSSFLSAFLNSGGSRLC